MSRVIALLTDFGLSDSYVGIMKGVILTRCPEARLVDITHLTPPQDVFSGALHLLAAVPYFPADTIYLAVVDPGVGSDRRALCIRAGTSLFVGPDNGLLWPAAASLGTPEAFVLNRSEFWLPHTSSTFHGRDVFAPVAAALASGCQPENVGSPITDPVSLTIPTPVPESNRIRGEILFIDHFGNAITNLRPADLGEPAPETATFTVGEHTIRGPSLCYEAGRPGIPIIVLGSWGYFEIAVKGGNASLQLGLQRGCPVYSNVDGE